MKVNNRVAAPHEQPSLSLRGQANQCPGEERQPCKHRTAERIKEKQIWQQSQ